MGVINENILSLIKGDNGKDALWCNTISTGSEPQAGGTCSLGSAYFISRTPENGEKFLALWRNTNDNNHPYFVNLQIASDTSPFSCNILYVSDMKGLDGEGIDGTSIYTAYKYFTVDTFTVECIAGFEEIINTKRKLIRGDTIINTDGLVFEVRETKEISSLTDTATIAPIMADNGQVNLKGEDGLSALTYAEIVELSGESPSISTGITTKPQYFNRAPVAGEYVNICAKGTTGRSFILYCTVNNDTSARVQTIMETTGAQGAAGGGGLENILSFVGNTFSEVDDADINKSINGTFDMLSRTPVVGERLYIPFYNTDDGENTGFGCIAYAEITSVDNASSTFRAKILLFTEGFPIIDFGGTTNMVVAKQDDGFRFYTELELVYSGSNVRTLDMPSKIPLKAGNGVSIEVSSDRKYIEISATGGGSGGSTLYQHQIVLSIGNGASVPIKLMCRVNIFSHDNTPINTFAALAAKLQELPQPYSIVSGMAYNQNGTALGGEDPYNIVSIAAVPPNFTTITITAIGYNGTTNTSRSVNLTESTENLVISDSVKEVV